MPNADCGVYKIINKINNKYYYGSAVNFANRWRVHIHELKNNYHSNTHLQAAWNKYGAAAFEFSVVLECLPEECIIYEQIYLDLYWDGGIYCYNIYPVAGSRLGVKATKQTREKQSLAKIGKQTWNKGKKLSNDIKKNMSEAKQGKNHPLFGKKHSIETRKKMSNARMGKIPYNKGKKHHLGKTWKIIDGKRIWIKDGV